MDLRTDWMVLRLGTDFVRGIETMGADERVGVRPGMSEKGVLWSERPGGKICWVSIT